MLQLFRQILVKKLNIQLCTDIAENDKGACCKISLFFSPHITLTASVILTNHLGIYQREIHSTIPKLTIWIWKGLWYWMPSAPRRTLPSICIVIFVGESFQRNAQLDCGTFCNIKNVVCHKVRVDVTKEENQILNKSPTRSISILSSDWQLAQWHQWNCYP